MKNLTLVFPTPIVRFKAGESGCCSGFPEISRPLPSLTFGKLNCKQRTHCLQVKGATAEYPATTVPDSTCAHIFKERDMCRNKLTQVAGYSAVEHIW